MANLLQTIEDTAARGAGGLTPEARESVAGALQALQCPGGGFAGLDGRADPYYSFFAWLSLRALGAAYDRGRLCVYMDANRRHANRINAYCAELVLAVEGRTAQRSWLRFAAAIVRGDTRGVYAAFLLMLTARHVPRWVARLAWRGQKRRLARAVVERLPTPRLAAGCVLATLAETDAAGILSVLHARRCASGGFASVANAAPDLLATAIARFACSFGPAMPCPRLGNERGPESHTREDLTFIEACWREDGLFGASPSALHGDGEHTFYGLLALGTCRAV